jgi:fatty-acyl-CoA synthase
MTAKPTLAPADRDTAGLVRRSRQQSLGDLLHRTARRYPGKAAVVFRDQRLTYAEYDRRVNRTAHALTARGVAKGDRVAVLSHNCLDYVVVSFALAKLGAIMVPVNFMLTADEIAFILGHAEASGLLVEDALRDVAEKAIEASGAAVTVRGWIRLAGLPAPAGWEDVAGWGTSGPDEAPDTEIDDEDPLRLMYTSGTESRPKGVLLSSRSLIAQYVSCVVDGGMEADDVELHTLPLYHCAQLDCFFGPDVYLGATSVILPAPVPEQILATLAAERATKFFAPPTVWIGLLRSPAFDTTDLSSLRKGYYGASPMPVEVLRELSARLPDVRFWNFYGQTEMAPMATILRPHEQLPNAGSAGRPAINVETRVVDDYGAPVPVGAIGEVVHRSPHAALGYWRDEEKTAAAFDGGWFHSGDLGVLDADGYLTIVDRKKDMIKTGGENVASREVEEAIYTLDGVAEVAVYAIPHPRWVEAVTATVVPRPGATLTADQVIAHARTKLAHFKAPKYVVIADALPKNPSGKILKRTLRARDTGLAAEVPQP